MKKLSVLIALLFFANLLSAQVIEPKANRSISEDYLRKAKSFKRASTFTAISGGTLVLAGGIWYLGSGISGVVETNDPEPGMRTGKILFFTGCGLLASSIPLAILGQKNREKARLYLGSTSLHIPGGGRQMSAGLRRNIEYRTRNKECRGLEKMRL